MPEAGPNAVEPPGRPLGLSAVNIASESGHDTSSSFASESAKPEKADVPKLESAAPDSQRDHWVFLMLALMPNPSQAPYCKLQANRPSQMKLESPPDGSFKSRLTAECPDACSGPDHTSVHNLPQLAVLSGLLDRFASSQSGLAHCASTGGRWWLALCPFNHGLCCESVGFNGFVTPSTVSRLLRRSKKAIPTLRCLRMSSNPVLMTCSRSSTSRTSRTLHCSPWSTFSPGSLEILGIDLE